MPEWYQIRLEGSDPIWNKPITVTSWLRPPAINQIVGGVSNSQHLLGWAVDIQIEGYDPHDVAAKIAPYWQGGLGDIAILNEKLKF